MLVEKLCYEELDKRKPGDSERGVLKEILSAPLYRYAAPGGLVNIDAVNVVLKSVNIPVGVEYFSRHYGRVPTLHLLADDLSDIEMSDLAREYRCSIRRLNGSAQNLVVFGRSAPYRRNPEGCRHIGCLLGLKHDISKGIYINPDLSKDDMTTFFTLTKKECFSWDFFLEQLPKAAKIMDSLADTASRQIFAGKIRAHISGHCGYIPVSPYYQYYHPKVKPLPGDYLFEGGAYNGSTTREFSQAVGSAGRIFAFEPLPEDYSGIYENVGHLANTTVENCGLWSTETYLTIHMDNSASGVTTSVAVDSMNCKMMDLDSYFAQNKLLRCDMIKMDIEGAEPEAIRGALKIISKFRPKLAISIYHLPYSQLFDIPLQIMDIYSDGHFYMGHHDITQDEVVLYVSDK